MVALPVFTQLAKGNGPPKHANVTSGSTSGTSVLGSIVTKTATATLAPYEDNVLVDSTAGAVTLTLPPAAACAFRCFSIQVSVFVSAVTLQAGADADDLGTHTVSAANDWVIFFSNGRNWLALFQYEVG